MAQTSKSELCALDDVPADMSDADVYIAATDDSPPSQQQQQQQQAPPPRRASLPPIALARPVGAASTTRGLVSTASTTGAGTDSSSHVASSSGVRFMLVQATPAAASREPFALPTHQSPQSEAPQLVVVLSRAQVEAVEQYRWVAFFIFLLYVMTFFAWPSYIMSACGLATGLVGYGSCRMSQQGSRNNLSWVILFIAANYVMLLFLAWVFASFFIRDLQQRSSDGQPAMILLAIFVALGVLLHARAQRIARDFLKAFRGGVTLLPRPRRGSLTVVRPHRSLYVHDASSLAAPPPLPRAGRMSSATTGTVAQAA